MGKKGGKVEEVKRGEAVAVIYCMREKLRQKLKKKKNKLTSGYLREDVE